MKFPILQSVQKCLDSFYYSKKIPQLIFHGPSGSGKREVVEHFLTQIYGGDKAKMKSNIMWVNCAHGSGRGIKFIREELKFFAKTNIQFNCGVMFKTIVLMNADSLTIDAQSALRRCIELFSFNTRFFIIVENKDKLLNPILSRFCEIYLAERRTPLGKNLNLHQHTIQEAFSLDEWKKNHKMNLNKIMKNVCQTSHKELVDLVSILYESGYSCLDLVEWFKSLLERTDNEQLDPVSITSIVLCFHKIKAEFRCEKLLMLYLLDYAFLRPNKALENVGFM
jgi:DNA polymerase III delta prime subunit